MLGETPNALRTARERFERSVVGVERDIRNPIAGPREPPRGTLQQQAATHFTGGFIDERPEDAVKLGSALVSEAGQLGRASFQVERSGYGFRKSLVFAAVHNRNLSWPFVERLIWSPISARFGSAGVDNRKERRCTWQFPFLNWSP